MKKAIHIFIPLFLCSVAIFGQDAHFSGYGTAIVKESHVEISTHGFKDQAKTAKYDSMTVQPVGSVSKVIIGLALMKAIELGYVNLDTDINQYIDFKVLNPNLKNHQPITMRHLATHTSGIKDNEKFYIQAYSKGLTSPVSLKEFLLSYFEENGKRYSNQNFGKLQAGEAYNYSNIGAALAAYVIESATKIPFDQFTGKYIFEPLGMKYTHWFYDETKIGTYAQLFDEKDNPMDYYSLATYPDGALKTNLVDLVKFLKALIKGYEGDQAILNGRSWETFFAKNFSETKPIVGINPKEPNSGIFILYAKSGSIGHTGSDPGVSAFMFFNPDNKKGKIFMANEDLTSHNLDLFKQIWESLDQIDN